MPLHLSVIVILSIAASFGNAVGINLQKWSMVKEAEKPENCRRKPFFQPVWLLGLTPQIIKALADFVFVGMAPVSLLAPLGALSLGFNTILAPIFHPGEKASRNVWIATGWIYVGVILTVVFAPSADPSFDLDKLIQLLGKVPFWGFILFCAVFASTITYRGRKNGYGRVYYCGMAGCIGGWNIIFAKGTSELIQNAIATKDPTDWTTHPLPYLFLIGLVASVTGTLTFLNLGLAKFEALIVLPVYLSFWNAFAITGSLIYYQEYLYMSTVDGIVYSGGIGVMMLGVTLLVRERRKEIDITEHQAENGDDADFMVDVEKGLSMRSGNRTVDDDIDDSGSSSSLDGPVSEDEDDGIPEVDHVPGDEVSDDEEEGHEVTVSVRPGLAGWIQSSLNGLSSEVVIHTPLDKP